MNMCCPDCGTETELYFEDIDGQLINREFTQRCPNCGTIVLASVLIRTPNEYQQLAMRTCSIPYEDKQGMLIHATTGLASEAGEFAGLLQKTYQGHEYDCEHAVKELGDCLWMIAEACTALGTTMEAVMQTNIDKLRARYPDGFDPEKSLHRREGDV